LGGINVFPQSESFKYPQKYHLLTNMRPKRITRKVKIGMDEQTYNQAKELADKLTFSNLSELIRILVRERYEKEKGGKA